MYFWIHSNVKNYRVKINLMGIIAFWRSAVKHWQRGSPKWMVRKQMRGIAMCFKQLLFSVKKDSTSKNENQSNKTIGSVE